MFKRIVSQDINDIAISDGNLNISSIKNLISSNIPTILEIGANCGQTTLELINHFPNAVIHCFEPDPRAIKKFKNSINSPNVHLHEIAIGNSDGYIKFFQSSGVEWIDANGWDHSGSIRAPKAHLEMFPWVKFEKNIEVPIMKLDSWAKQNNIVDVDFIWADVQGAELDLILGGTETLNHTKFFYTEYYNNECYEGQIPLIKMYEYLNHFLILKKYDNDVLFENIIATNKLSRSIISNLLSSDLLLNDIELFCSTYGMDRSTFDLIYHSND